MKHLMTLMALVVAMTSGAQVTNVNYDPDANGDNSIGVDDLLALLSLFGESDVDDDGIWDSADDCLSDSCAHRAYLIIEPFALGAQIGTYMYHHGATQFYGWSNGGVLAAGNDEDWSLYLAFFDEYAGTDVIPWSDLNGDGIENPDEMNIGITVPAIITSEIPQFNGGSDGFGNYQSQYQFNILEVPMNHAVGLFHWVIVIADESMGANGQVHRVVEVASGGTASACYGEHNLDLGINAFSSSFGGNQIPSGNYRANSVNGTIYFDVDSGPLFFRCTGIDEVD